MRACNRSAGRAASAFVLPGAFSEPVSFADLRQRNGAELISIEDPRYPQLGELAFVFAITAWSSLDDEW